MRPSADALIAAALLAVDPNGLGGARLRARPGAVRDQWLDHFLKLVSPVAPMRKLPIGADADRIVGGLDIGATLVAGKPVAERGVLAAADGGILVVPMAERMSRATAAIVAGAMDAGLVHIERGGASRRDPARFACLLFDEGLDGEEAPPGLLLDRVALHLDLEARGDDASARSWTRREVEAATRSFNDIDCPDRIASAIAAATAAFHVNSIRPLMFCLRAARAAAALAGRGSVDQDDAETACRLVLGPRALHEEAANDAPPPRENRSDPTDQERSTESASNDRTLEETLIEATRAAALGAVFTGRACALPRHASAGAHGKAGAPAESFLSGRPAGSRKGLPRGGARLDLLATLRAAAPLQKLRANFGPPSRVAIYKDDLRVKRFVARSETVVIFAVDASGSSAMHRMAEAKGAVELLLADCYSRRDHVALIAFRGSRAEVLLPPTRSLVRVRRRLAALPGGGGTPLAAGLAAAAILAESERRRGRSPFVVILSDGRGNIAIDGSADRARAEDDTSAAARRLRAAGCTVLFFDTATRPGARAQALSKEIGARYSALPYAASAHVSRAVQAAVAAASASAGR